MSKKKIVVVVPELLPVPPVKGGAVEHWVHEAVNRMSQDEYDITVISRPSGIESENGIKYFGIPWTKVELFFHRIKEKVTWKNPFRYIAKFQNVFSYAARLGQMVDDFDIVCIHNEPNLLFFLNKKPGQKIVLHMHNDHLCAKLFRPFYRAALKKVDSVICVSDYIRASALRFYPEYADKFTVVFNSTDTNEFRPYPGEDRAQLSDVIKFEDDVQYILYVGRLSPVKGVHVLIEAFKQVHSRFPNTKLIITGSSFFGGAAKTAYESELVALAQSINDAIIFTGYLTHNKLKYLYSAVDIISVPSVWQDPCPLVILEGMASGTCVIGSRVGGVPEVLENRVNGLLIAPGDPVSLAEGIGVVLQDKQLRATLGENAREKISASYQWERLVHEIEVIFKGV